MPANQSQFSGIKIDRSSDTPVYRQLIAQFNCIIQANQLAGGQVLPTIRALAAELGINPNTVARAYAELQAGGMITKRQGSGCCVSESMPKLGSKEKRALLADQIEQLVFRANELGVTSTELARWVTEKAGGVGVGLGTRATRKTPAPSPKPSDAPAPESPTIWQPDDEFID